MKNRSRWYAFVLPCVGAIAGCGGGGGGGATDAGGVDARSDGEHEATVDARSSDVASDAEGGSVPQRVLVTANGSTTSQLVAVNVETKKVDGRLTFPGFGVTDAHSTLFPFVLEQSKSVVARLDAVRPWIIDSSWNILLNDATDGGFAYADPYAVVVGAGNKAYVLRYNRNEIAVINTSQAVDSGPPTSTIDLSSLVQSGGDGNVEMTSGVYLAAKNMLYVVLENINQNTVVAPNFDLLCTDTVSTVVGIDTTNDKLVSIGGGPGGSITLSGFDPVPGGLVYDALNDRLLLLEAGCNPAPPGDAGADAGPGAIQQRGVEAVNLSDGTTTVLLDTSTAFPSGEGYPTGFVYIDEHDAVLGFDAAGAEVYKWDPTRSKLGTVIPNAPDFFTYDGVGNLLGTVTTTSSDGGSSPPSVVSVAVATGKSTTLYDNSDLFSTPVDFIAGVDVWPHP